MCCLNDSDLDHLLNSETGKERKKKKKTRALRIGGEAFLVVNQQGEGDETLVEENENGSGHVQRLFAFAWFSLGVTMATHPSSLAYLPAYLSAFSAQTTQPGSRATGSAPERTAAAAAADSTTHLIILFHSRA